MAQHSSTLQFSASRLPAGERLAEQVGSIRLKVEHDVLHSTLIARGDTRNCMAMILKPHGFEYNRNLKRWERAGTGPEAVLAGMQRIAERDGVIFETFRTNEPVRKRSLADFLAGDLGVGPGPSRTQYHGLEDWGRYQASLVACAAICAGSVWSVRVDCRGEHHAAGAGLGCE